MTRLKLAAALLTCSLLISLSVHGLSEDEDKIESTSTAAASAEIDIEEIHAQVARSLEGVP